MGKLTIFFKQTVQASMTEPDNEVKYEYMKHLVLESIKKRLKWFSELEDKELLNFCEIKVENPSSVMDSTRAF